MRLATLHQYLFSVVNGMREATQGVHRASDSQLLGDGEDECSRMLVGC
jgi:hypothetical protein